MKWLLALSVVTVSVGMAVSISAQPRIINQDGPDLHIARAEITKKRIVDLIDITLCRERHRTTGNPFDDVELDCASQIESATKAKAIMPFSIKARASTGKYNYTLNPLDRLPECRIVEFITATPRDSLTLADAIGFYVQKPEGLGIISKGELVEVGQGYFYVGGPAVLHRFVGRTQCDSLPVEDEEKIVFKAFIDFVVLRENVAYRNWDTVTGCVPRQFRQEPNYVIGTKNREIFDITRCLIR